ncbi:MAG TPA: hypothetical protein VHR88_02275 [Solirubrobacteraceae bacterium]|nr:hypothetical protein [Solirubrobacteraceae bacterium]
MPEGVANGVTLAYDVFGEDRPVVLLPGAELPRGGHWRLGVDPPEVHIRALALLEEVRGRSS